MAFDLHANLAYSTVAIAPSPAISGATLTMQTGDGSKFPAPPFNVLIWPAGVGRPLISNAEIARVTAMSGDAITAMTRATATEPVAIGPRTVVIGDQITLVDSVKTLTDIEALVTLLKAAKTIVSTTGNITALALPAGVGPLVIYLTNASLATIQGIAAGLDGQELTLIPQGAGQVDLAYMSGSGTSLGRLHNIATSGNTSLAAGEGVAKYVYDLTNTRWNLVYHEQGTWITRTFAAGNYTASAGTWTVASATRDAYWLKGRTLLFSFSVSGTTSGTPVTVKIAIPGGFVAAGNDTQPYYVQGNGSGGAEGGYVTVSASGTTVNCQRFANATFGAGTVTTDSCMPFEVQ